MGLHKLHQVVGFAKDAASVGKAYVRNFSDNIEVAVLRATNHRQSHCDDRTVERILLHVSFHPESVPSLVDSISRRLDKTRDRVVTLKTLFLIHRILRGNRQVHIARAFGNLQLGCCWFMKKQDPSSAFLQNYAAYLQERAGWIVYRSCGRLEPIRSSNVKCFRCNEEVSMDPVFHILPKCQEFIDKLLNCALFSTATADKLVHLALCTILDESFQVYRSYSDVMKELLGTFSDRSRPERARACGILRKATQQSRDLCGFYEKCRECVGDKSLDYPSVEAINMECITALEQSTSYTPSSSVLMSNRFHPKFSSRISCLTY